MLRHVFRHFDILVWVLFLLSLVAPKIFFKIKLFQHIWQRPRLMLEVLNLAKDEYTDLTGLGQDDAAFLVLYFHS